MTIRSRVATVPIRFRSFILGNAVVAALAASPLNAQVPTSDDPGTFTMPTLGSAAKATVLAPDLRSEAGALEASEYRVLIPGCMQQEPGVFICKSILEYQHCRTLMIARLVFSCRAGLAFDGGFAEPRMAEESDYTLELESNATVRVTLGDRGMGQIRGKARLALALEPPADVEDASCLQRDSYVYYPTGPDGGTAVFGEPQDCDATIEHEFEANEDDLIRAYDLCESFAAWGSEIDDSIDILIAGLFQMRSASPEFSARHEGGRAVIAPYVHVEAPLGIDCRD